LLYDWSTVKLSNFYLVAEVWSQFLSRTSEFFIKNRPNFTFHSYTKSLVRHSDSSHTEKRRFDSRAGILTSESKVLSLGSMKNKNWFDFIFSWYSKLIKYFTKKLKINEVLLRKRIPKRTGTASGHYSKNYLLFSVSI